MYNERYNSPYTENKTITEKYILDKECNLIVSNDDLKGIDKYIFTSYKDVLKSMNNTKKYFVYSIYNVGNENYISLGAKDNCRYILSKRDLMIRDSKFKAGDNHGE